MAADISTNPDISLETEPLPPEGETGPDEVEQYLFHLESVGLPLTPELWHKLITRLEYADLSTDEIGQLYGIRPLATINREGMLQMDESCHELSQEQRRYILSHELGHRLTEIIAQDPELNRNLGEALTPLIERNDPREVSFYVAYLAESLAGKEGAADKINSEVYAELIAQYLSSDGTFGGMMRQKLLQFPDQTGQLTDRQRAYYTKLAQQINSVEEYLNQGADLPEGEQKNSFFAHHPKLADHYRLFVALQTALTAPQLTERLASLETEEATEWEDWSVDIWDDWAMLENFSPALDDSFYRPDTSASSSLFGGKPSQPASLGIKDLFNFWDIFAG